MDKDEFELGGFIVGSEVLEGGLDVCEFIGEQVPLLFVEAPFEF